MLNKKTSKAKIPKLDLYQKAKDFLRKRKAQEALKIVEESLKEGEEGFDWKLLEVHCFLALNRYKEAQKRALFLIQEGKESAEIYRLVAFSSASLGKLATTCENLERALKIDATDSLSRELYNRLSKPSSLPHPQVGKTVITPSEQQALLDRFLEEEGLKEISSKEISQAASQGPTSEMILSDSVVTMLTDDDRGKRDPREEISAPSTSVSDSMIEEISPVSQETQKTRLVPKMAEIAVKKESGTKNDPSGWKPQKGMDVGAGTGSKYDGTLQMEAMKRPFESAFLDSLSEDKEEEESEKTVLEKKAEPPKESLVDFSLGYSSDSMGSDSTEMIERKLEQSNSEEMQIENKPGQIEESDSSDVAQTEDSQVERTREISGELFVAEDAKSAGKPISENTSSEEASNADLFSLLVATEGSQKSVEASTTSTESVAPVEELREDTTSTIQDMEESGWDPLLSAQEEIEQPSTAFSFESEFTESNLKKRIGIGVLVLILLGAGIFGFLQYRDYRFLSEKNREIKDNYFLGTLGSLRKAEAAAKLILSKKSENAEAKSALAALEMVFTYEFGEDHLGEANRRLKETEGKDSMWRTVAKGYSALMKDPAQAAGYLRKGTEIYSESAVLYSLLGRALAESGVFEEAEKSIQKAIQLEPTYIHAKLNLALVKGKRREAQTELAFSVLDKVLQKEPKHVVALVAKARLAAHQKRSLQQAKEIAASVVGPLAEQAGRTQLSWAHLVLAKVARYQDDLSSMTQALDQSLKAPPCCDPQFRYELSEELMKVYRYSDAYQQLEAAIKFMPKHPPFLQKMGWLLLEMGQNKEAEKFIEQSPGKEVTTKILQGRLAYSTQKHAQAIDFLKDIVEAKSIASDHDLFTDANIYLWMSESAKGRSKVAVKELSAIAQKNRSEHRIHQAIGMIHIGEGNLESAEKALRQAWKINGIDPLTPTLLAKISVVIGDYARAEKRLQTALKRRPDYALALVELAKISIERGEFVQTQRYTDQIASAQKNSAMVHLLQAELELAKGNLDTAEQWLIQAQDQGIGAASMLCGQGKLALARGSIKSSIKDLEKALSIESQNKDILLALSRAYIAARKIDSAYDKLLILLKIDSNHPQGLLELSKISLLDGETAEALRKLEKAKKAAMERKLSINIQAKIFTALATAYYQKKKYGQALAHLEDAIEMGSGDAEPYYQMGLTYQALERPQRAKGYFNKAIELDPTRVVVYFSAGKSCFEAKDSTCAEKFLNEFIKRAKKSNSKRKEALKFLKKI